jgi:adenylate cyclase
MGRLILATTDGVQAVELRPVNSLGRHPSNSIQLLDKIVSKEHCVVERRGSIFVLRDLGSLNGTFINGDRVRGEAPLKHGDEVLLGSTRARFDDGTGAPVTAPALSAGVANLAQQTGPLRPNNGWPASSSGSPAGFGSQAPPPVSPSQGPGSAPAAGPNVAYRPSYPGGPTPAIASTPASAGFAPSLAGAGLPGVPPAAGAKKLHTAAMAISPPGRLGSGMGTKVDMLESARAIERQIQVRTAGFLPFDQVAQDAGQLRLDYERLRLSWDLAREIALERDFERLLDKILSAIFKFVNADRGVILIREADGSLSPHAAQRRDGTDVPIEVSSTILNHVIAERASVLTHDASHDFAAAKGKSMILNRISSAMVVPLVSESQVLGAVWLDSPALAQFQPKDLEVVSSIASQAALFIENTLLAKKIEHEIVTRERFSRLLSPNVAERVISGELEVKKGGVKVPECTVFNSDIRGFTSMSEGTSAEAMVELLNEYFELMVEVIFKHEGTLDKFMGDGIMAIWGAPAQHREDALRSVSCALEQLNVLGKFNRRQLTTGGEPLAIGIGIHTGPLVAGYVGSSRALSYTVIGDTANTSARLCGAAQPGQILVSESTIKLLGDKFEYEELKPIALKGKEKPLRIFNVERERTR